MPLITVFFPGPRKAIIDQAHKDFFIKLGAVETQAAVDEKQEEKTEQPQQMPNPDQGFGRPGDLQWHTLQVHNLKSKYAVYKYCKEVTGKGCDRRLNLDSHRKQTIELIREHLQNGES